MAFVTLRGCPIQSEAIPLQNSFVVVCLFVLLLSLLLLLDVTKLLFLRCIRIFFQKKDMNRTVKSKKALNEHYSSKKKKKKKKRLTDGFRITKLQCAQTRGIIMNLFELPPPPTPLEWRRISEDSYWTENKGKEICSVIRQWSGLGLGESGVGMRGIKPPTILESGDKKMQAEASVNYDHCDSCALKTVRMDFLYPHWFFYIKKKKETKGWCEYILCDFVILKLESPTFQREWNSLKIIKFHCTATPTLN